MYLSILNNLYAVYDYWYEKSSNTKNKWYLNGIIGINGTFWLFLTRLLHCLLIFRSKKTWIYKMYSQMYM